MPQDTTTETLRAVLRLIGDRELEERLADPDQADAVLERLGLPKHAGGQLLSILARLDHIREESKEAVGGRVEAGGVPGGGVQDDIGPMLLESFEHIKFSFWISMGMSIVLFLVGLAFLSVAGVRALSETQVSGGTLTIAGIGLADFVLLFYRTPWRDLATNLANSQQVKMVVTSYLASLSLIGTGRGGDLERLGALTRDSVVLLEEYAEERDGADRPAANPAEE